MNFNNGKNIGVVINFPNEKAPENVTDILEGLGKFGNFGYIIHDKDELPNGEPKTLHAHVVIEAEKGASSGTWVKRMCETFGVPEECISVDTIKSLDGAWRYLIHKDNPEKHQYTLEEVATNNPETLKKAIERPSNGVSLDGLMNCKNVYELARYVGVTQYSRYKKCWDDMREFAKKEEREADYCERLSGDIAEAVTRISDIIRFHPLEKKTIEALQDVQAILTFGFQHWNDKRR